MSYSLCSTLTAASLVLSLGLVPTPPAAASNLPGTLRAEEFTLLPETPQSILQLIHQALALSARGPRYTYGSADPARGGMDCSGTIHHLLVSSGWKGIPRQANTLYAWVWQ